MDAPLRTAIAKLDGTQKKVLGAVITAMLGHHTKVREREWIAEQYVSAVTLALEPELAMEADPHAGVARVQEFARTHRDAILRPAFLLFGQVARDMELRESFTYDDAVAQAMRYLGSADEA